MAKKTEKKSESKQEMPFPSREAALEALEKSTLSDAEKARLSEPVAPVADAVARMESTADKGVIFIDGKDISPEDRERFLAEAKKNLPPIQVMHLPSEDEQAALARLRPLSRPGESLVQAVERMEALAKREADLERERDEAREALGYVREVAEARGWSETKSPKTLDVFLADELTATGDVRTRLEALARATTAPAVGVIVQEIAPSQYKVHVLESDAEGVRVWDTEPKESLPWHAARVLVDRVVETKLTPEDKR